MNQNKRIGIKHIFDFSPKEFLNLIKYINTEMNGIISQDNCNITLKVDGSSFKFGYDNSKKQIFAESAYVGPIYESCGFSNYCFNKYGSYPPIINGFDNLLNIFNKNEKIKNFISSFGNIKIYSELLYFPIGKISNKKITFVDIPYDIDKLGNIATLILLKINDENNLPHPKEKFIIKYFIDILSSKEIKFIDIYEKYDYINLIEFTANILKIFNDKTFNILISRKKIDKEEKDNLKKVILGLQYEMHYKILSKMKTNLIGDIAEGWVFKLQNGIIFKVNTNEWNNLNRKRKK